MDTARSLQVVIIERPIDTWDDPMTATIFHKMISMKLRGYGLKHAYGVLPIDTTDFVSDHIIIGDISSGTFETISGWKSISYETCMQFRQQFPPLHVAKDAGAHDHVLAINQILAENHGKCIRYCSAYTVEPKVRDRPTLAIIKTLIGGMGFWFHETYKTDVSLVTGVVPTKVDKMFESFGWQPLTLNDQVLPSIQPASYNKYESRMFLLGKWSDLMRRYGEQCHQLWEKRITLRRKENSAPATLEQVRALVQ